MRTASVVGSGPGDLATSSGARPKTTALAPWGPSANVRQSRFLDIHRSCANGCWDIRPDPVVSRVGVHQGPHVGVVGVDGFGADDVPIGFGVPGSMATQPVLLASDPSLQSVAFVVTEPQAVAELADLSSGLVELVCQRDDGTVDRLQCLRLGGPQ